MSQAVEYLLAELRGGLERLYRQRLCDVRLYGSYARKEAERDSDLDVLIILDHIEAYGAEIDRTSELISTISLKYGVSVSRVFVPEQSWRGGQGAFLTNVREESVPA